MILADSSAWIEWFRDSRSPVHLRLLELIQQDAPVVTTEAVVLEILAGARDEEHAERLQATLYAFDVLNAHGLEDYEHAARIYRACRRAGETVRRHLDCLIAAVAIREGAAVLHRDRDFEVISRHTPLRIA